MSILKIARMGHPILRTRAKTVEAFDDPELIRLVTDMKETMLDAQGRGLAANQVYVPKRVVVYIPPEENENAKEGPEEITNIVVLINPEIEPLTDEIENDWEGCLSVPNLRGVVPRITKIRLKAQNLSGEFIDEELSDYHARVVQHECDHLEGILYPMRMQNLETLIFESEISHLSSAGEN